MRESLRNLEKLGQFIHNHLSQSPEAKRFTFARGFLGKLSHCVSEALSSSRRQQAEHERMKTALAEVCGQRDGLLESSSNSRRVQSDEQMDGQTLLKELKEALVRRD